MVSSTMKKLLVNVTNDLIKQVLRYIYLASGHIVNEQEEQGEEVNLQRNKIHLLSMETVQFSILVSMAEWSKAPDSSSGLRKGAWVRTPLLTIYQSDGTGFYQSAHTSSNDDWQNAHFLLSIQ